MEAELRPIRLAIVSPQRVIAEALRALLDRQDGLAVVGESLPLSQADDPLRDVKADVVLLDMSTPGLEGMERLRTIRRQCPEAKLLLLMAGPDDATILDALRAGARGYVSKDASATDLGRAIRGVHEGAVWAERKVLLRCLRAESSTEAGGPAAHARAEVALTARQQEVLRLLARGGTNRDVAHALRISGKTVKTHLTSIFRKLQVTRRVEAVLYAVRRGLR